MIPDHIPYRKRCNAEAKATRVIARDRDGTKLRNGEVAAILSGAFAGMYGCIVGVAYPYWENCVKVAVYRTLKDAVMGTNAVKVGHILKDHRVVWMPKGRVAARMREEEMAEVEKNLEQIDRHHHSSRSLWLVDLHRGSVAETYCQYPYHNLKERGFQMVKLIEKMRGYSQAGRNPNDFLVIDGEREFVCTCTMEGCWYWDIISEKRRDGQTLESGGQSDELRLMREMVRRGIRIKGGGPGCVAPFDSIEEWEEYTGEKFPY